MKSGFGTLIAPKLILTCAHNIIDKTKKDRPLADNIYIKVTGNKMVKVSQHRYLPDHLHSQDR